MCCIHKILINLSYFTLHTHSKHSIHEVEQLIKKHEAFEKSAATQEERFVALTRQTMVRLMF